MTLYKWLDTPGHTIGEWTSLDGGDLVNTRGILACVQIFRDVIPAIMYGIREKCEVGRLHLDCPDMPAEETASVLSGHVDKVVRTVNASMEPMTTEVAMKILADTRKEGRS